MPSPRQDHRRTTKRIHYLFHGIPDGQSLKNSLYNLGLVEPFTEALTAFGTNRSGSLPASLTQASAMAAWAAWPPATWMAWPPMVTTAPATPSCTSTASSSRSWSTAGRPSCPTTGCPAARSGCFPVPELRRGGPLRRPDPRSAWERRLPPCGPRGRQRRHRPCPTTCIVSGYDGRGRQPCCACGRPAPRASIWTCSTRATMCGAMEQNAMAEAISKVLYPNDNHPEGKSLRLSPAVFPGVPPRCRTSSAAIWTVYGTLDNLPRQGRHPYQRHPSHPGHPRADAHSAGRLRLQLGQAPGTSSPAPLPTPTTPSWPRRWSAGTRISSSRCCPASIRSCVEINRRFCAGAVWSTGARTRQRSAGWPSLSYGMVRMANLCVVGLPHRQRRVQAALARSSRTTCSTTSTALDARRSSATSPTASPTAAGCARPIPA